MKTFSLFLILLVSAPLWALDLHYLTPESVQIDDFPPPPVSGSEEDLADLEAVREWQRVRSTLECARAEVEEGGYADDFYGPPYGPLSLEVAVKLRPFHQRLYDDLNYFSRILKKRWGRPRPFVRDEDIKPCIPFKASGSYPSGHAAISFVGSRALTLLFPELKQAFIERQKTITEDRVVGGVHHPKDVAAGVELGRRVFEALEKSPAFQADLKVQLE